MARLSIGIELRRVGLATLVVGVAGAWHVTAQNLELLGTARTVLIQSDVVFNGKNRAYNATAVPYSSIVRSGLLKSFRVVQANPNIIIKFHKDALLVDYEKISLTVFDAEDNSVIYTEERTLVDEENDVSKLVTHFLARVKAARDARADELAAEVEREKNTARAERDEQALKDAKVVLSIYSSSDALLQAIVEENRNKPNECHVFLRGVQTPEKADVVLTEKVKKGVYVLTLMSRDDNEILHTQAVPEAYPKRAIALMSKWITSTPWE